MKRRTIYNTVFLESQIISTLTLKTCKLNLNSPHYKVKCSCIIARMLLLEAFSIISFSSVERLW